MTPRQLAAALRISLESRKIYAANLRIANGPFQDPAVRTMFGENAESWAYRTAERYEQMRAGGAVVHVNY